MICRRTTTRIRTGPPAPAAPGSFGPSPPQDWEIDEPSAAPSRRQGRPREADHPARRLADPAAVAALGLGAPWRAPAQAGQRRDESHLDGDLRAVLGRPGRALLRAPHRRLRDGLLEVVGRGPWRPRL